MNNLANFINRVLVLTRKFYDGIVPEVNMSNKFQDPEGRIVTISDSLGWLEGQIVQIDTAIRQFSFREAMQLVMEVSSAGNQILQINEPWKQIKTDPEAVKPVMFISLQIVDLISRVIRPFLPFTADRLDVFLGWETTPEQGRIQEMLESLRQKEPLLKPGHVIGEPGHLFDRIPDEIIDLQIARLHASNSTIAPTVSTQPDFIAPKTEIQYEQFAGMDLRSGVIVAAEKVPKADRLLKLAVDVGFEQRTIVSGIAEYFQPDEIIGQQVVVLVNLAPRTLKGIESQGMILMASGPDGTLYFIQPGQPVPAGCVIN